MKENSERTATPYDDVFRTMLSDGGIRFYLMLTMEKLYYNGYMPINKDSEGYYFNFIELEGMVEKGNTENILDTLCMLEDVLNEHGLNILRIDYYNMLRMYMFDIASIYKEYYDLVKPLVMESVNDMELMINKKSDIVIKQGQYSNQIVYMEENKDVIHIVNQDVNSLKNFEIFQNQAKVNFDLCEMGMYEVP